MSLQFKRLFLKRERNKLLFRSTNLFSRGQRPLCYVCVCVLVVVRRTPVLRPAEWFYRNRLADTSSPSPSEIPNERFIFCARRDSRTCRGYEWRRSKPLIGMLFVPASSFSFLFRDYSFEHNAFILIIFFFVRFDFDSVSLRPLLWRYYEYRYFPLRLYSLGIFLGIFLFSVQLKLFQTRVEFTCLLRTKTIVSMGIRFSASYLAI